MKSGLAWRFRMGVEECTYNCSSLARKLDATHAGAALPRHALLDRRTHAFLVS